MAGGGVRLVSAPEAGVGLARPWGSALRASHFLLLRQKKVSKEKATPRSAPGSARSLALLATGGGCGTRGYAPQTVLALFPPAAALLSASQGDPKGGAGPSTTRKIHCCGQPEKRPKIEKQRSNPDGLPGPLEGAEQRRKAGGLRRALFEGRSPELRSRPAFRVAQGTGVAGADPGSPFLCLLSFGEAKESKTRLKRGNPKFRTRNPAHKHPNLAHQNP